MSRPQKRIVAGLLQLEGLSERKACNLLKLSRSVCRYLSKKSSDHELRVALKKLGYKHRRYGYRRLYLRLRKVYKVNVKKVYRLYREEGLKIRIKRSKKRSHLVVKSPLQVPEQMNIRWSMDFVSDNISTDRRRFRVLNIIDDFSRECLGMDVYFSIPSHRVISCLERIFSIRDKPKQIVMDNGPEFTSNVFISWASKQGIDLHFIDKGKPTQNAFVESFNGKFRDECLNENWFNNIDEAKQVIEEWRIEYNTERPHSALGNCTPKEYRLKNQAA